MPPSCGTGMHMYLVISGLSLLTAVNKSITSWACSHFFDSGLLWSYLVQTLTGTIWRSTGARTGPG
jgi:hypothetical protein